MPIKIGNNDNQSDEQVNITIQGKIHAHKISLIYLYLIVFVFILSAFFAIRFWL